jgi:Baseplate structural protein Gp10, C-terminal domain
MATVTGLTAERMLEIEAASVVGGHIDGSGHLILERFDETEIDSGSILASFALIYPVGSIYLSVNNTNPSTLFGGTWVAFGAGKMPIGVNGADPRIDAAEETGGTETISAAMLPVHTHPIGGSTGADATHTHAAGTLDAAAEAAHTHGVGTYTMGTETADHGHSFNSPISISATPAQGAHGDGSLAVQHGATTNRSVENYTASGTVGGRNAAHAHILTGSSAAGASHDHVISGSTAAGSSHSHTLPAATGNSTTPSATLLPPFISVYMWKRTA